MSPMTESATVQSSPVVSSQSSMPSLSASEIRRAEEEEEDEQRYRDHVAVTKFRRLSKDDLLAEMTPTQIMQNLGHIL